MASVAVLLMVLAALGIGLGIYASSHQNRIYEGVAVAGVDLGGKTRSQARSLLEPVLARYTTAPITLVSGDKEFLVDPTGAGVGFDLDATADRAFAFGRSGSIVERVARWSRALLHGAEVRPVVTIDDARLDSVLAIVADQVTIAPVNASIVVGGEAGAAISPESSGIGFDLTAVKGLIHEHFATLSDQPIALVLPVLPPEVTTADLAVGLATAQAIATDSLLIRGPDGRAWRIERQDLQRLVSYSPTNGSLRINTNAIEELVVALAGEIDRDVVNATAFVNDRGEILVREAVDARVVDQVSSLAAIEAAIRNGVPTAYLVVETTPAQIQTPTARAAAERIEAIVDEGIELTWDEGSVQLSRRELLAALTIEVDPAAENPFTLGFDETVLTTVITPLLTPIESEARNARLRLIDSEITVVDPARDRVEVDIAATVEAVRQAALMSEKTVAVALSRTPATITEEGLAQIRLDDVLATGTTSLAESSEARRANIERAVELGNGWLVAPGQTFSFLTAVGATTETAGYSVAVGVIVDDEGRMTWGPVAGGGVSQVATTLFQAVFWTGLPVIDRHTHPTWIAAFGESPTGMRGLDALVNASGGERLDFRFRNTTENWIAILLEVDGDQIVATIRGTNPGWTVRADEPVISAIVEPGDGEQIIETPELAPGSEIDLPAEEGFTAAITRVVTKNGETISEDLFSGTYEASQAVTLRGVDEATGSD